MEEEIAILREEIKNLKVEKNDDFEFYTGVLSGKDVVLLRCGIGKVQAAVGCAVLVMKYAPSLIINTGSAGGVNPVEEKIKLNFGDAVISSALAYHDVDITSFGYKRGQLPGKKSEFFFVKDELIKTMERAVVDLKDDNKLPQDFKAVSGIIVSGDSFISDSKVVYNLEKYFKGIRAVEMEGAAIAHTCDIFNTPFIILRCLSDIAGEESPVKFDEYLPVAAKNSSMIVKQFIGTV
jgi:adenosylhomocysteine nucleosidase